MSDRIRTRSGRFIRLRLFLFFGPVVFERVQVRKFWWSNNGYGRTERRKWVWRKPRPGEIAEAKRIRDLEREQRPGCYGTYPFLYPHIAAERDCRRCPVEGKCYQASSL